MSGQDLGKARRTDRQMDDIALTSYKRRSFRVYKNQRTLQILKIMVGCRSNSVYMYLYDECFRKIGGDEWNITM